MTLQPSSTVLLKLLLLVRGLRGVFFFHLLFVVRIKEILYTINLAKN